MTNSILQFFCLVYMKIISKKNDEKITRKELGAYIVMFFEIIILMNSFKASIKKLFWTVAMILIFWLEFLITHGEADENFTLKVL